MALNKQSTGIIKIKLINSKFMNFKISQMSPYIGEKEIKEMADSIKVNWITEGPKAKKFTESILNFMGARYGVLAPNGTLALYMALMVLGIKKGDEVIVPDFTFIASANAVYLTGAKPVFIDIRKDDFNLDPNLIENKITPRTKAIMPVHIYGQSVDMDAVMKIAKRHNLLVIEDACQGLGVYYKKTKHVGTIGDVGCFSFFADKTISTGGEGGMVITNNKGLYEKLLYFRNQGRLNAGTFIHPQIGYNFRMNDLQAAFGLAQLRKLDYIIKRKLENYNLYKKYLSDIPEVQFLKEMPYSNIIPFRVNIIVKDLNNLMDYLVKNEIQTRSCFYPLHLQPGYGIYKYKSKDFPNSIFAYQNAMSLPVHLNLSKADIKYICDTIKSFYKE